MNAYKVWSGDAGYMLIIAETPIAAKLDYWTNFARAEEMFEKGADMHYRLIEKDVEITDENAYEKSRYFDLIFAGVIHPDWALGKMAYDWWYEDTSPSTPTDNE